MPALDQLQLLLRETAQLPRGFRARLETSRRDLLATVASLEKKFQEGASGVSDEDQIRTSVRNFVRQGRLESLRDAQRVCFGLARRVDERPCLFEDRRLLTKVLDQNDGIGQWRAKPRAFRRCFRGLAASYFSFDGSSAASPLVRSNWSNLREYLRKHVANIHGEGRDPGWVAIVEDHPYVFTDSPFGDLPIEALEGNSALLKEVFDALLVGGDSWFRRDLLLAQVKRAAEFDDHKFNDLIRTLIELVEGSPLVRDEALAVMLDRYMRCTSLVENKLLRETAVEWWGNPWLPSQELHWGRVKPATRKAVASWLHREFIEAFFSKLAADGQDGRRAKFWKRYIGVFTDMKFGLGRRTLFSPDPDFKKLIAKMKGLCGPIDCTDGDAFIMTLGQLTVVEFSSYSNAMYGYDVNQGLPFVVEEGKLLRTTVDAPNSLKQTGNCLVLRLRHQDGVAGFDRWESRFEHELAERLGIAPRGNGGHAPQVAERRPGLRTPDRGPIALPEGFCALARDNNLPVENLLASGGNLWVRSENISHSVNATLRAMGFGYKPGKGWWWNKR